MSTRPDDQLDAALRRFLAARAADTAGMPTAADVAARVAARPARRAASLPALKPALILVLLLAALIASIGMSAFLAGSRGISLLDTSLGTPANGLIALAANRNVGAGAEGDIYLLGAGAPARRIIGSDHDGVAQACPSFSPDGRRIAYGEGSDITFTPRGLKGVVERGVVVSGLTERGDAAPPVLRLAPIAGGAEIPCPEWSPDGKFIAFRTSAGLWVADTATGQTRSLEAAGTDPGQADFEWSRDGSRIAVSEPGAIRVVQVESGTSEVIAVPGMTPAFLGWTARDEKLVYVATRDAFGEGVAARVVDTGGGNDRSLTGELQPVVDSAVVSPDGTRVALVESTPCTADGCIGSAGRVLTMAPDGSAVTEVSVPPGASISEWSPDTMRAWSPDGERLLFASLDGVFSLPVVPGSTATVYSSNGLDLEWTGGEVTWQPVFH
jgi:Tol biopolymer transport system component